MKKPVPKIDLRTLMNLPKAPPSQAVHYLDQPHYKFRDSEIIVVNNDRDLPEHKYAGKLTKIDNIGEVTFISNEDNQETTIRLGQKLILIVLKDGKPFHAVLNE